MVSPFLCSDINRYYMLKINILYLEMLYWHPLLAVPEKLL